MVTRNWLHRKRGSRDAKPGAAVEDRLRHTTVRRVLARFAQEDLVFASRRKAAGEDRSCRSAAYDDVVKCCRQPHAPQQQRSAQHRTLGRGLSLLRLGAGREHPHTESRQRHGVGAVRNSGGAAVQALRHRRGTAIGEVAALRCDIPFRLRLLRGPVAHCADAAGSSRSAAAYTDVAGAFTTSSTSPASATEARYSTMIVSAT